MPFRVWNPNYLGDQREQWEELVRAYRKQQSDPRDEKSIWAELLGIANGGGLLVVIPNEQGQIAGYLAAKRLGDGSDGSVGVEIVQWHEDEKAANVRQISSALLETAQRYARDNMAELILLRSRQIDHTGRAHKKRAEVLKRLGFCPEHIVYYKGVEQG